MNILEDSLPKAGSFIKFNLIFEEKGSNYGLITKVKKDYNFCYTLEIMTHEKEFLCLPITIIEYDILF